MSKIKDFLLDLIEAQASAEALDWLNKQVDRYQSTESDTLFYMAFGRVPRHFGNESLDLTEEKQSQANHLEQLIGLNPSFWTTAQAVRIYLLLQIYRPDASEYQAKIDKILSTADMGEQVALFSSFALLPHRDRLVNQAIDGLRTNITDVFDAIALNNPFPATYFSEGAWNQMVLKAAFLDRPIYRIYGIEERANPTLATIISDFAHERWAAGRIVSPELWRLFGTHLQPNMLSDIEKLLESTDKLQQKAGILVCKGSELPEVKALMNNYSIDLKNQVFTWNSVAKEWWDRKAANE